MKERKKDVKEKGVKDQAVSIFKALFRCRFAIYDIIFVAIRRNTASDMGDGTDDCMLCPEVVTQH